MDRGLNLIHLAAREGQLETLEWLHEQQPPGVHDLFLARDKKGRIPADSSASGG